MEEFNSWGNHPVLGTLSELFNPNRSVMSPEAQRADAIRSAGSSLLASLVPTQPADFLGPVGAALTYSPESHSAILPKGTQMPSGVLAHLKRAFADDPAMYKYATQEYGRVGDRMYDLAKAGVKPEIRRGPSYESTVYDMLMGQPTNLPKGTNPKEASKLANPTARTRANTYMLYEKNEPYSRLDEFVLSGDAGPLAKHFENTRAINVLPDIYEDSVRTAVRPMEDLLKEVGIDPKKLPIDQRFKKAGEYASKRMDLGTKKLMDTGEGNYIVELNSADAFRKEGNRMGNSVGGYAEKGMYSLGGREAIEKGAAKVFSVRDKNGRPRINIEVDMTTNPPTVIQVKRQGNDTNFTSNDTVDLEKFFDKTGYQLGDHPMGYASGSELPKSLQMKLKYSEPKKYSSAYDFQEVDNGYDFFEEDAYDPLRNMPEPQRGPENQVPFDFDGQQTLQWHEMPRPMREEYYQQMLNGLPQTDANRIPYETYSLLRNNYVTLHSYLNYLDEAGINRPLDRDAVMDVIREIQTDLEIPF